MLRDHDPHDLHTEEGFTSYLMHGVYPMPLMEMGQRWDMTRCGKPPRAGRSRSARPQPSIPGTTRSSSPKTLLRILWLCAKPLCVIPQKEGSLTRRCGTWQELRAAVQGGPWDEVWPCHPPEDVWQ